jgi:hypothetical protein
MRRIVREAGGQMTVAARGMEGRLELLPATSFGLLVEQASAWLGLLVKLIGWCWIPPAVRTGRSGPKERAARRATASAGPWLIS